MMRSALALAFSLLGTAAFAQTAVVKDLYSAPYMGELVSITVGSTAYTPGRALKVICTVGGTLSLTYADGTTGTWTVQGGTPAVTTIIPAAVIKVTANTGGTCSSYVNLK